MSTEFRHLFTPLKIGPVEVRNRLATSGHHSGFADGSPVFGQPGMYGERYARYLAERAKGGCGLITFGQVAIHPTTAYEIPNCAIGWDERAIPGMKLAADMCHEHGAKVFAQIYHSGINNAGKHSGLRVWGPSAVGNIPSSISGEVAREMEEEDIEELKLAYAQTARNIRAAGLDGIEIHATHSYLLHTFMSPLYNFRTDKYGGSLENRLRLVLEVIDVVREAIGDQMALGLRIPGDDLIPGGNDVEAMKEIAVRLDATGKVDFLNVSLGTIHSYTTLIPNMYFPHAPYVYLAAGIKEVVQRAKVFCFGRIVDPLEAEQILADGQADMVIMNRAHIADPELGNKAREGRLEEIRACVGDCQGCLGGGGGHIHCVQNIAVGNEKELGIGTLQPAPTSKRVLVIGGGPAGLEAAWVAAARGHDVTLYEKSGELGGQNILAGRLPGRAEMEGFTRWRKTMVKKHGVKVKLNTEVTPELVQAEQPDVVVVATGSQPRKDGFNAYTLRPLVGWEQENVVSATDVVAGTVTVGDNVVVYDVENHIRGPSVSELLAAQGKRVRLVYPGLALASTVDVTHIETFMKRIATNDNIETIPQTLVLAIEGNTVHALAALRREPVLLEGVDTLVIAGFGTSDDGIYKQLKGNVKELHLVGDAVAPRTIAHALVDGHRVGRAI